MPNPRRFLMLTAVLAGTTIGLAGCDIFEAKVTSPFTGQQVTEAGLLLEVQREEAKAKSAAADAASKAAEEIRAARAKATATMIALQQKQAVTAAEISATAQTVEAETGQRIAAATEAAARQREAASDVARFFAAAGLAQPVGHFRAARANHHPVGFHAIVDRGPFLQKLRIAHHVAVAPGQLAQPAVNGRIGSHWYGALDHHNRAGL